MALTKTQNQYRKSIIFNLIVLGFVLILFLGQAQSAQRFCGSSLTEALKLLCRDGYKNKLKRSGNANEVLTLYASDIGKTSPSDAVTEYSLTPAKTGQISSPFVAFYGTFLTQYHQRRRRNYIGAYDECCRKPCNVAEMTAYCYVP